MEVIIRSDIFNILHSNLHNQFSSLLITHNNLPLKISILEMTILKLITTFDYVSLKMVKNDDTNVYIAL